MTETQTAIYTLLPYVPERRKKEALASLGFYHAAEFARLMGCSRQYISRVKDKYEIIIYDEREYFRFTNN